jgi:hypothetical protein
MRHFLIKKTAGLYGFDCRFYHTLKRKKVLVLHKIS